MPEPEPPQQGRRWSAIAGGLTAFVTAIAGLIAALAATGVFGGGDDPVEPAAAVATAPLTTAVETTGAKPLLSFNPTPDEERLLESIPEDIQRSCVRTEGRDPAFAGEVSLYCYDPALEDPGYLRFVSFDTPARLAEYMDGRRSLGNQARRCGSGPSGSGVYRGADGQTAGELICYSDDAGAWIEWSDEAKLVWGLALKPDGDWSALYDFWARVGPARS